MKTNKTSIWNVAKMAKERLRKNNYQRNGKISIINNTTCFENYIVSQKENKLHIIKEKSQNKTTYDDRLYKRVCKILEENNTQNPISLLIDRELFSNLDVEAKQFYINNLTQKYKNMKTKYYREHTFAL